MKTITKLMVGVIAAAALMGSFTALAGETTDGEKAKIRFMVAVAIASLERKRSDEALARRRFI